METLNITNGDIILEFITWSRPCFLCGAETTQQSRFRPAGNLWAATGMILAMIATMAFTAMRQGMPSREPTLLYSWCHCHWRVIGA
jgi:hypothetical protein